MIEGVSFILLMGVAMPLKYLADMPMAVKIVGWAHGVLFMLLCVAILQALVAGWRFSQGVLAFVAALLPFGPFLVDGRFKKDQLAFSDAEKAAP